MFTGEENAVPNRIDLRVLRLLIACSENSGKRRLSEHSGLGLMKVRLCLISKRSHTNWRAASMHLNRHTLFASICTFA